MAEDIRFGQILRQLLNERFRNRRKDFARSIHVSESALSQYVRGKATPSLHVLVEIARALDVSLDYLVLGITEDAPAAGYGDLVSHVEEAINRTQVKTATLRDFVGRVGSTLAENIESTARRLLAENGAAVLGIGLTEDETRELESISKIIRIATADLDPDVPPLGDVDRGDPDEEAPDRLGQAFRSFTPVISHNVHRGSEYSYVIPDGIEWRVQARRLRNAVCDSTPSSRALADRRVRFFASSRPLVPGYVMYTVDTALVTTRTERLLDRIKDFVHADSNMVALAEPPSRQSIYYSLIDPRHHQRMVDDHDALTRTCPRLVFD